ncbi:hypothetical protein CHUAL_007105 [Chamberlinius hualienensis]
MSSTRNVNDLIPVKGERHNYVNWPHVIVTVGLPARGKTYISKKLARYLNWIGVKTQVFNVGEYRRLATVTYKNHDFFRPDNIEAVAVRDKCAIEALEDACDWLKKGGEVAVFDATNTTRHRRRMIFETVVEKYKYKCFFLESICDDPTIIDSNIMEVKINSPDYTDMNKDDAVQDFIMRIGHFESQYETMDEAFEPDYSFIKIFNTGEKVLVFKHEGPIQSRIVYYLMNLHVTPRTIYLSRHGESEYNLVNRIGGDPHLSEGGKEYAKNLAAYVKEQNIGRLRVWTSLLERTIETASGIDAPQERWKALNEIDAGICEEMTYEEIRDKLSKDFEARDENKFSYRYPRGESYEDLVTRLEPVIMELERRQNIMVISHQAVIRCLLAYFIDKTSEELPYIKVPLHTVVKLTPIAYGCKVEYIPLGPESVDTHRDKPEVPGSLEGKFLSPNAL